MIYSLLQEIFVFAFFLICSKLFANFLKKRHSKQSMSHKTCLFQNTTQVCFLNLNWNHTYLATQCKKNILLICFYSQELTSYERECHMVAFLSKTMWRSLRQEPVVVFPLCKENLYSLSHFLSWISHMSFINFCLYSSILSYTRGLCEI